MFADYGDFGRRRGLSRIVRSVVKAPVKITKAAIKAPLTITQKITKPALKLTTMPLKAVSKVTGMATGMLFRKPGASSESIIEAVPSLEQTIAPQMDIMTAAQIPQNMPTVTPMQQPQVMPQNAPVHNYAPQQQQYAPPTPQQVQQYEQEQSQPEQSYYSEQSMPIQEGSAQEDEFRPQESEEQEYNYDTEDFSGYGLDEDTRLLIKDASSNVNAAIEAGSKYVSTIQGKNSNQPAVVSKDIPMTGLNAIPTWMWFALGASVLAMIATSNKKKR